MFFNIFDTKANMKPLTLLSVLQMFDTSAGLTSKINTLPSLYHEEIFDFNYPLSTNVNKDDFEIKILKHFILRRIGFETIQAFKLMLDDKLNTIMPKYNVMFDNYYHNLNLYSKTDVEVEEYEASGSNSGTNSNNTTNSSTSNTTSDNRMSDTPQNSIADVQSGTYLSEYSYNVDNGSNSDTSVSSGTNRNETEDEYTRTRNNTINLYGKDILEITQNIENVYELIFNDLDELFYQLF